MFKWLFFGLILFTGLVFSESTFSQTATKSSGKPTLVMAPKSNWPKELKTGNNRIVIYQPQPDSLVGNKLYARSAISVSSNGGDPLFGAIWVMTTISADRTSGEVSLINALVLNVRFPNQDSIPKDKLDSFKDYLEKEIPKWEITSTIDELTATLKENAKELDGTNIFNNDPPEIIFVNKPAVLVLFDGDPSFKATDNPEIQRAINTPFLVLKDMNDKQYYLNGENSWFKANNIITGTWALVKNPPKEIKKAEENFEKQVPHDTLPATKKPVIPQIIVRTKPAELLQSDGDPNFAPIQGTNLLYVTNSENNIFKNIDNQLTYILISGRWYSAKSMSGPWTFIPSSKLPADFAKIPEGSEKDVVLASVAGTDAAKEAIMDAQIPQTAAVDRKTASCTVKYDGDPKFEQIKGTLLYRAVNTGSTVILSNKSYYVCENAVWFIGNTPDGPWSVATEIPADIQKIPPEDPAYNVKYVYIYDVRPDVIYMGYLPGYTGCYVAGPTIIYGTGFPYPCWVGPYYYPLPVTWGFSMGYNPWIGWSIGFGVSVGFFHMSFWGPAYHGGWWGPPMYHPPYCPPYNHCYGHGPVYVHNTTVNINTVNRNNFNQNNIYNNHRNGVQPVTKSRTNGGNSGVSPSDRRGNSDMNRASKANDVQNNVFTDRNGNVYRKNGNNWEQHDGKNWQPAGGNVTGTRSEQKGPSASGASTRPANNYDQNQLDRQNTNRSRGMQQNFNRNAGSGMRSGGGSMRGGRR